MDSIWLRTCDDLGIPRDVALKWLQKIQEKLSEPGRYFHNWVELLLRKKEFLNGVTAAVVLAVFFQYYEFDVKRNCVEENCEVFREFCNEAGFQNGNVVKRVTKLLGDVSCEELPEFETDANIFQDLDLLVLGSSPGEYQNYTQLLRKEYSHLDDVNYKKMRLKILQTFLTIPTIYQTAEFRDKFEEAARRNVKNEIDELKQ